MVILRDKDANNSGGWAGAADSVMEERIYYCHNWRADVLALIVSGGGLAQHVRYGEYGDPLGMPSGDADGDGDYDAVDQAQLQAWHLLGPYDVRGDTDLDGDVDLNDYNKLNFRTLGWGKLSETAIFNRKGYAGYETDHIVAAAVRLNHVRNRVYNVTLGRWMTRDPSQTYAQPTLLENALGSDDESSAVAITDMSADSDLTVDMLSDEFSYERNLYDYVDTNPLTWVDDDGLKKRNPSDERKRKLKEKKWKKIRPKVKALQDHSRLRNARAMQAVINWERFKVVSRVLDIGGKVIKVATRASCLWNCKKKFEKCVEDARRDHERCLGMSRGYP